MAEPQAWEPWPEDTAICVVCGGPLPEFPARLVSGDNESGPLCGCFAVPIAPLTDRDPEPVRSMSTQGQNGPSVPVQPRGVYVDYCPDCGTSGGSPCRTPSGRKRPDHKARKPECNGQEKCNLHGFVIGSRPM